MRAAFAWAAIGVTAATATANAPAASDANSRVALPVATSGQATALATEDVSCAQVNEYRRWCAHFARGNDYQVLQWLLTAQADAAVISGFTWALIQGSGEWNLHDRFRVLAQSPWPGLSIREYHVTLRALRSGRELPDAAAGFEAFLRSLLPGAVAADDTPQFVHVPSHLSPALPWLVERAEAWLGQRTSDADIRRQFWQRFLHRLRFTVEGDATARTDAETILVAGTAADCGPPRVLCLTEQPLNDILVIRDATGARAPVRLPPPYERWFGRGEADGKPALDPPLREFAASNYQPVAVGPRLRYRFLFTLDELWPILRHAGGDLALVLTGGGVKAAYQTALIDDFYREHWLVNDPDGVARAGTPALPVKFVIGTSGGALLGAFVSARTGASEASFTDQIWFEHGEEGARALDSNDVFPWMDLMRWLSFLGCLLAFVIVSGMRSAWVRWRGGGAVPAPRVAKEARVMHWFRLLVWTALLAFTPYLVRFTNGEAAAAEHIPELEGIFYFFCTLIAVYSDARLRALESASRPMGFPVLGSLALLATGIAATLLGLYLANRGGAWLELRKPFEALNVKLQITMPALIACLGMLVVFFAVQRLIEPARRLDADGDHKVMGRGFLLLVLVVVATNLLFWPVVAAGLGTWFEFRSSFWVPLLSLAFVVSAALLYLGYGGGVPSPVQGWVRPGMDYLLSLHPSRLLLFRQRHWRIFIFFAASWTWWNAVMAPAIYGNEAATTRFNEVFDTVANDFGAPCADKKPPVAPADRCLRLQNYFVAPVTVLARGVERYVLFQPAAGYERKDRQGETLPADQAWNALTYDPRWHLITEPADHDRLLERVVFASGSPFPIFPAHRIDLRRGEFESVVDGGYAHNVPVEAAKQLGANRVLVLSSSPWESPTAGEDGSWWSKVFGNFIRQIGRLVPYLYERSQIEDVLSGQDLLVARIAPSADPRGWPFLMDFRAPVIERMVCEARRDRGERIGDVESWGLPALARVPAGAVWKRR